jgi:capsular polysaccharide biosynthesis protein
MNESFGLIGVLKVFIKWKIQIMAFAGISAVGAAIVTLMIPNYYESMTIFYPTNPALTDRQMLFTEKMDQYFDYFGSKNDVNRMLAIASSADVTDFLINHYNLAQHYKIDTTDKLWRWKTRKKLMNNYTAIKNELSAVEITIVDEDRELAAEMANKIVEMIDKLNKSIILKNKQNILAIYKNKLDEKEEETRMFADSLSRMRVRYKIEELESPDGGIISIKGNDANAVEHFKILLRKQYNAIKDLNNVTTVYEQYAATLKDEVSSVFIVEKAHPSEKKKGPLRSLIVISVLLISLFVAVIAALIAEKASELKRQLQHAK